METFSRRTYLSACALAGFVFIAGLAEGPGFAGAINYASHSFAPGGTKPSKMIAYSGDVPLRDLEGGEISETGTTKHVKTPEAVRAIYMSSWVAATPSMRARIVKLVDETELNAIVLDVKDYTGKIAFKVSNPELAKFGSSENRIRDIHEFLAELHEKGIYVIGRIAVFQDPYYVARRPDLAVLRSDGGVWADRKGAVWVDPGARPMWDYTAAIAREAYAVGFDEANFDYVRFPSDGNMQDTVFPVSRSRPKREVIKEFWTELNWEMRKAGIPSSADVFGMTTTAADDMNIGQVFEDALANFDYVAPMIYPSHYPSGFEGIANPAARPYDIIRHATLSAVERARAASSTPAKLRPWLQDFDLGAEYGAEEVKAQILALGELGVHSWMVWDPSNVYTEGAYQRNLQGN